MFVIRTYNESIQIVILDEQVCTPGSVQSAHAKVGTERGRPVTSLLSKAGRACVGLFTSSANIDLVPALCWVPKLRVACNCTVHNPKRLLVKRERRKHQHDHPGETAGVAAELELRLIWEQKASQKNLL